MATVLVVEDNPVNMKLATLLLRKAGHTVLCAVDAETGLTIARIAMATNANHDEGRIADCEAYLAKPLRYQELYAAIDTLLTRKKPQRAGEVDSLPNADLKASVTAFQPGAVRTTQQFPTRHKLLPEAGLRLQRPVYQVVNDSSAIMRFWHEGISLCDSSRRR